MFIYYWINFKKKSRILEIINNINIKENKIKILLLILVYNFLLQDDILKIIKKYKIKLNLSNLRLDCPMASSPHKQKKPTLFIY